MTFDDLPQIEEGSWGWVLYRAPASGDLSILYYDNDELDCECPEACDCDPKAACYVHPLLVERVLLVDYGDLRRIPNSFDRSIPSYPAKRQGWVYAIALIPEIDIGRIKLGWTTKHIGDRFKAYRTANPTALLLGLWDADAIDEVRVLAAMSDRVGDSEVISSKDPWATIGRIDALLRGGPQ